MLDGDIEISQGAHGEYKKGQARFHVQDTGTPEPAIGHIHGHVLDRAHSPDSVRMAEGQYLPLLVFSWKLEF